MRIDFDSKILDYNVGFVINGEYHYIDDIKNIIINKYKKDDIELLKLDFDREGIKYTIKYNNVIVSAYLEEN